MNQDNWDFDQVILGEPASSKNRRQIVRIRGVPRLIKGKKALAYAKEFERQCHVLDDLITEDVVLMIDAYYASRRPDLAALELIQDLLQGKVYANDRQVKAHASVWNLDRDNPRVRVRVRRLPNPPEEDTYSSLGEGEIFSE